MALSQVIMPKTGAEMEEGKIVSWKKQPGERVATGEILLEIETDKATMDVESPATGLLLRSLFPAGENVPATNLIAVIGDGTESAEEIASFIQSISRPGSAPAAPVAPEPAAALAPQTGSKASDQRVKASPLARRLAQEKGIDLASIQGTGPEGRIEKDDVIRAAEAKVAEPSRNDEVIKLSAMRRAIGRRVRASKQEIPDFSVTMIMDMAAALRKKSDLQAAGKLVSLNDLIIFATARTLVAHPDLNAQLEADSLRHHRDVNVGFAVGTAEGLYLPVVRHADRLRVEEIAAETERLTRKIESKQIAEEDLSGATFTVSNLGMFGVESFTAIIVPPQTGILSLGTIVEQAVRGDASAIAWQPVMSATLTVDHRVVDGLAAAKFLRDLKAQLAVL
jgi:pyruvate dehydrogenase E2 component (dihydrolipoamide acetyltransferase)